MARRRPPPPPVQPSQPKGYVPGPNAKRYYMDNTELERVLIRYVSEQLGVSPPFVHHIQKDVGLGKVVITLEPVANVLEFRRK